MMMKITQQATLPCRPAKVLEWGTNRDCHGAEDMGSDTNTAVR